MSGAAPWVLVTIAIVKMIVGLDHPKLDRWLAGALVLAALATMTTNIH